LRLLAFSEQPIERELITGGRVSLKPVGRGRSLRADFGPLSTVALVSKLSMLHRDQLDAVASAVASTSRQVAASPGVALAGSLAGTAIESAHGPDFAAATHVFFRVSAGLGMAWQSSCRAFLGQQAGNRGNSSTSAA
jgi:hypothetical protein